VIPDRVVSDSGDVHGFVLMLYRSYTVRYYKRALGDFVVSVQYLAIEMTLVQRSGSVLILLGENQFCFRHLGAST